MAAKVSDKAKGRFVEWGVPVASGNAAQTFKALLLTTSESLTTISRYDSIGAMLAAGAGANNVECVGAGYARQTLTSITVAEDNTSADKNTIDSADITFGAIAAGSAITKAVIYLQQSGGDNNCPIVTVQDFTVTPDGSTIVELVANFAEAD